MKTSSEGQEPPVLDRSKAWSYLVSNLLVLPGLGSILGGRKAGYAQVLLALGGFGLTLYAGARIVLAWSREFAFPDEPGLYRKVILGIALFLIGWIWSLLTSLDLFRQP